MTALAENFDALMEPVVLRLLGEPAEKNGADWRYGRHGSLSVDISKGAWFDHEAGQGGGVLDLIRRQGPADPIAWLRAEGLLGPSPTQRSSQKIVAAYDYDDERGELLFQVVRLEPRRFLQRRPNGKGGWIWDLDGIRRVPYRLPKVLKALAAGVTIFIPEGEKDVDNIRALGLAATCNPGGAKKWRDEYSEHLRGADIVVVSDNDVPGREHAGQVVASLTGIAKRVRLLDIGKLWPECPHKGDISDWLAAGGNAAKLEAMVAADLEEATAATSHNQASGKSPLHSWEAPDWSILDDRRGVLPAFPVDCLGKAFKTVRRAAHGAGVTDAHVAVPLLGIASGLVGIARRVQASRSWLEPMTMWCAIVGFSGTGKTPGLEVVKRTLSAIERDKRDKIAALRRKHDTKVEAARAAKATWKKKVEAAAEKGASAPEMPKEAQDPGKFITPKLFVSDGTIERLGELLNARPQGIIRILDELAAMFTNMQRYSGGQDNEFWLEAWNGNSFNVERIGRQLAIDYLLVGVVGGFQPDKLAKAFKGDDDGMYTRFAFSWPEEAPHKKLADEIGHIDENLKSALARLDALAMRDKDDALIVREIKLSDLARAEFEQFRQFVHEQKDFLDGREREWVSKAPAHALRLAGTLCLLDWAWNEGLAEPTEIEALYLQRAVKLVREYFWPHARAALRLTGLSERHAVARRVLRWIRARGFEEISLKDVRREALSQSLDEAGTKALLDKLVAAGWLRPEVPVSSGGRPARRWSVNPKLNAESAESAESLTNGCETQPEIGLSAVPALSASQTDFSPERGNGGGNGAPHPLDIPDFLDRR